jgi:ELWxxDGT repeat protein
VAFSGYSPAIGDELFVTDGTPTGTEGLDLVPGVGGSFPSGLAPGHTKLFFVAEDATSGREPWLSDGTLGGTMRIADLFPGSGDSMYTGEFCAHGDAVVFSATRPSEGYELWFSDGTDVGTSLIADISSGSVDSYPSTFVAWRGRTYFVARDSGFFSSLRVTDGSAAHTRRVAGVPEEFIIDYPRDLEIVGSTLCFTTSNGVLGYEPWAIDLCAADTDLDGDLAVPDIFAFLSAWFTGSPVADYDGNSQIAVPDIFAFLSAWFAGC